MRDHHVPETHAPTTYTPTIISLTVIWDFNGTILNDVELSVEGLNLLRRRRSMSDVTVDQYRGAFGFPVQEYYRGIGFDTKTEDFAELSREYHDFYFAEMYRCRPHQHIPELIRDLHANGIPQFVLSAMQEPELRRMLIELGISEYLDAVYGLGDLLAHSKVDRGRDLMQHQSIVADRAVMIGDTDHDVEVARALGVTPITLTLGHQAPERFAHCEHSCVDTVDDLRATLSALS